MVRILYQYFEGVRRVYWWDNYRCVAAFYFNQYISVDQVSFGGIMG